MALSVGDKAPSFSLPATDGKPITLKGFKGRKVALYFYPRDDTSGCTLQAQQFQALKA
jgi:thioredoxin-dependent peroxiredoxin